MFNISKLFENIVDLSYIPRFDNELSKKVINVYFFTSYHKILDASIDQSYYPRP